VVCLHFPVVFLVRIVNRLRSVNTQRFYDSLRQSSERTIKKISNKDFSMQNSANEYAKARGEKLGSFMDQQRQQNGDASQPTVLKNISFIVFESLAF
jgi:predicted ATPase